VSGGFIVGGKATCPVEGLSIRTFAEDGVHRFAAKGKRTRAVELVIHETVTRSVDSTIAVLKKRGLSVHLVMGADGALTQHGDLATDILWHASQHNGASFGVEVVNPYYPSYLKPGLPWDRVIKAPWAHKGEYVLPTPSQAEAVAALVRWTEHTRQRRLRGSRNEAQCEAPVPKPRPHARHRDARRGRARLAHQYFGHADGSMLVLYAWLRFEAGLAPDVAFEEAVKRATGVRRADVRDLLPTPAVA
jgi:hypothetical protein